MEDTASALTRVVKRAGIVVADADLPEPLRQHAFVRVLDLLLEEAALTSRPGVPSAGGDARSMAARRPAEPSADEPSSPLERIAQRAGTSPEVAKTVFRLEHDQLSLVVGDKRLDRNKATASRQITLLVAGGRQAAGFEEWTNLSHAREVCAVYNRLDSKNYAATVKGMADVFNVHGQGVRREVRLTMPGWDEWTELVRRLASGADRLDVAP